MQNINRYKLLSSCLLAATLLAGCASTGSSGSGLSLMDAVEQTGEKIASDLPAGTRVAIVAFESESGSLSDFVMEEIAGALVDRRMEVADRQNLGYVYKELNFQMTGDVSDETAQAIGKFLGAELVITGQLQNIGGTYRYRVSAVHVEKATRDSVTRLTVRNDRELQNMVTALARQQTAVKTAAYGAGGSSVPQTAGAFLDRGILFASRGEYDTAIMDFTEALKLNRNLSGAYTLRGRAYYAGASYVTGVGDNFSGVVTKSTGGNAATNQMQAYEQAVADFTEALRLDPDNAKTYKERGVAYSDKGDLDRAIADYNQAIRLDPNYASAYNSRGIAYSDKGDLDRAIADYNQVIRLDPNYAFAYNNRGIVYENKRDWDRAIADYSQAIRLDPNYANAYNNRGNAYYNKRDWDRAIVDYEAALRIDPNDADARQNLELARQQRGR